jgi:putative ABC transport system permease protein
MKLRATFLMALRALRRNKMRTVLTMLGIIIGVAAVIAMVAIGNGATTQVEDQIASLGQNVVLVFAGSVTSGGVRAGWGNAGTLKIPDADAIRREIPDAVAVSPEVRATNQISAGNQNWFTNIQGESPDYFTIRNWQFIEGTSFTDQDVRSSNKVAVIGGTIVRQLFDNDDPLGQILRVKGVPFTIVGVLETKGLSVMGQDQDDVVIMPYTSCMKRIMGVTNLRTINVEASSPDKIQAVQDEIADLLRQKHKIVEDHDDDFTIHNQQEFTAAATATSRILTILVVSIASVSLLVGGIGIMNIMLVSVTERTREIGIRMAVGAHGRDILLQFLIEATSLSSMGGIIGIILGIGASRLLSIFARWPTLVSPLSVVLSFLFSAAVGIFFGFYPAKKAAALDPIEALRYE